jgi:hypothetical protein
MLLLGPLAIVSSVLVVAGVWKVGRPQPALTALRAVRLPSSVLTVRAIGLAEATLGFTAILVGGTALPAAVAAAYVAFAFVAWRLRGSDVGCGCFGGASSTPPGPLHLVVNLASAAAAAAASIAGTSGVIDAWDELPAAGLAHVLLVAVGTVATLALLTVLPEARAAANGTIRHAQPVLFRVAPRRDERGTAA